MENSISSKSYDKHIHKVVARIKSLRESKGYSQEDLADACGMHPQSIARFEEGKVNPTIAYLSQIANGLEVDISAFFEK